MSADAYAHGTACAAAVALKAIEDDGLNDDSRETDSASLFFAATDPFKSIASR